jgi:hypothetical protein
MSLRQRLTLVYSGMLSGFVLLLSIVVYALVSLLFVEYVDRGLENQANQVISLLRADMIGNLNISSDNLLLPEDIYYQIWNREWSTC